MRNVECGFRDKGKKQRGFSLIAALFIIVVLAFMGVMFVSMINTSTLTSVNDMQSAQALFIAEGGMEYALEKQAFPDYVVAATDLGAGHFTIDAPSSLNGAITAATNPIVVNATPLASFPGAGRIVIDSELIDYTSWNGAQFGGPATRGVGGTQATAHAVDNAVYPVTTVTDNPLLIGSATINVTSNVGFSIPGTIMIDTEYIFCGTINGTTQFTNCARGYKDSQATAHPNLSNVFQYTLTSTGTVGNAQRAVVRSARQIPGAMMVYAKAAGDPIPYCRRWNGTSWGPELSANSVGAGRTIQYIVLKFARTRSEAMLGTLDSAGDVQVQVWNWNGINWGWRAPTVMGNTTAANSVYRGFDIEYETNGDRPIIVYNNDVARRASYRIWDSATSTWSAAQGVSAANFPSSGRNVWIELAPNPLAASNDIAMIVRTNAASPDVYGWLWTGGAWSNMGAAATWDTASAATGDIVDVTYEQQSGRAIFIWGDTNQGSPNQRLRYRIWDGITLNGPTNRVFALMPNLANWVRLVSDPTSDNMIVGVQDTARTLVTQFWNGAAWGNETLHDNATEDNASRNFDIVYETAPANAGRAWLIWGNGNAIGTSVSRRQWNNATATWGAATTTQDHTAFIQLLAHPISGAIFSAMYEDPASATADVWESHLTAAGATWSPKFTVWGGPALASPVYEKVYLGAERYNPLILFDWRENIK